MNKLEQTIIDISNIRRPLILIRGKSLTREQLLQIVGETEPIFKFWDNSESGIIANLAKHFNDRAYCGSLRNIMFRKGFNWLDGWLLEDGTCYGAYYLPKYPDDYQWVPVFKSLAESFPFLDMVATVINSDESFCYGCGLCESDSTHIKCESDCIIKKFPSLQNTFKSTHYYRFGKKDEPIPDKYKDIISNHYTYNFFAEYGFWNLPFNVEKYALATVHISNGDYYIHCGNSASELFKKYDKEYGDFRLSVTQNSDFFSCSSDKDKPSYCRFSTQFFRDCLEYLGLPRDLWDTKIVPEYLMEPKSTKEVVVTKDWLFSMYDEHFSNTLLDIRNIKNLYES